MSDFRNTTLRLLLGVVDRCVSTRQITTDKGAIVRAFLRRRCLLFSSYQPTLACATPERPERACWRGTSLHAREDRVGVFSGRSPKSSARMPVLAGRVGITLRIRPRAFAFFPRGTPAA